MLVPGDTIYPYTDPKLDDGKPKAELGSFRCNDYARRGGYCNPVPLYCRPLRFYYYDE